MAPIAGTGSPGWSTTLSLPLWRTRYSDHQRPEWPSKRRKAAILSEYWFSTGVAEVPMRWSRRWVSDSHREDRTARGSRGRSRSLVAEPVDVALLHDDVETAGFDLRPQLGGRAAISSREEVLDAAVGEVVAEPDGSK